MESVPCDEPHTLFRASHSRSLACSRALRLVSLTRALDSCSTCRQQHPSGYNQPLSPGEAGAQVSELTAASTATSSLIRSITSCVKVPGQRTWETRPLEQAS